MFTQIITRNITQKSLKIIIQFIIPTDFIEVKMFFFSQHPVAKKESNNKEILSNHVEKMIKVRL